MSNRIKHVSQRYWVSYLQLTFYFWSKVLSKVDHRYQSECILENALFIFNYGARIPFLVYMIDILRKQNFQGVQIIFIDKTESFNHWISPLRPCMVLICFPLLSQQASISAVRSAIQLLFESGTVSCDLWTAFFRWL